MEPLDADGCARVDAALRSWRQGDCVVGEQWFVFRTDPERPLTPDGASAATEGVDTAESKVFGFMVLTQTCDLVRKSSEWPCVEVCPLVEVDEGRLQEIERSRRPNYAYVPALADQRLVGDLDRVMTIEKAVVAGWDRVPGWKNDAEARRLALALERKRARVAFPDDFVEFAAPLMSRMSSKHDKQSDEGRALRALREIRVRADPSWDADEVDLTLVSRDESRRSLHWGWWIVLGGLLLPVVAIPLAAIVYVLVLKRFITLGPTGPVEPQWLWQVVVYASVVLLSLAIGFALGYRAHQVRAVHAAAAGLLGGALLLSAAGVRQGVIGSGSSVPPLASGLLVPLLVAGAMGLAGLLGERLKASR